jgi:hypothetical protein
MLVNDDGGSSITISIGGRRHRHRRRCCQAIAADIVMDIVTASTMMV